MTDVFVIGGGPAGLAAAIAARRRGLDFMAHERQHAKDVRGYFLRSQLDVVTWASPGVARLRQQVFDLERLP